MVNKGPGNPMLKVALISTFDYAGSGYRIAEAVNMNSKTFAEYFVYALWSIPKNLKRYPALFVFEHGR
jgi:hypothetical protein